MPVGSSTVSHNNQPNQMVGLNAPAHVIRAVADASERTGVSFSYLMAKADTESSFNPAAKARTSSATGLYQFIERTWLDMVDRHGAEYGLGDMAAAITRRSDGSFSVSDRATRQKILDLRKDPRISALMAAEYASENKQYLARHLNREITDTDLYLAHFLGAGGATRFLKALKRNPAASAVSIMPEAASANRGVFFTSGGRAKSLAQVYAGFEAKFGGDTQYARPQETEIRDASVQKPDDGAQLAALQPGAVPGAATPFLTTYLLSSLHSSGEQEEDGQNPAGYGAVPLTPSLFRTLA